MWSLLTKAIIHLDINEKPAVAHKTEKCVIGPVRYTAQWIKGPYHARINIPRSWSCQNGRHGTMGATTRSLPIQVSSSLQSPIWTSLSLSQWREGPNSWTRRRMGIEECWRLAAWAAGAVGGECLAVMLRGVYVKVCRTLLQGCVRLRRDIRQLESEVSN